MPSAMMAEESHGIAAVAAFGAFLDTLLAHAETVKPTAFIEPPLDKSDFDDLQHQLDDVLGSDLDQVQRFAVIETAVRDIFGNLIATTSIESPAFAKVWNLFDILSILSDSEQCDPALLFWLVEELLDSQTIDGCHKVFDYLESRRERITAKDFKQKKLVILRTCNELQRRLSRSQDSAFCGRLYIFMFQSFPLGDKSSVNLRGEYHVENVTTFDQQASDTDGSAEKMDLDVETPSEGLHKVNEQRKSPRASLLDGRKQQHPGKALDPDALYPIFWSLQQSFNQPKKLFDPVQFAAFKAGLEATVAHFWTILPEKPRSKDKQEKQGDEAKRSTKRKRDDSDDELATGFNPKYLTSRDLFELEISDIAFRRNVLVQALIVIEFLLSLSPKAKEKLVGVKVPNKAVIYSDHVLSEEDTKWVTEIKKTIAEYLRQGQEGPYFYRVVETVLARDKNWVRWKIENCPSIEVPPVSPQTFVDARESAAKMATCKRMRPVPLGSLPLEFLEDGDEARAMDKFKSADRYELPDLTTFQKKIADDDFEIEMPTNNDSKMAAVEGKASKTWRALRIASRYKLAAFDKVDSDDKIDAIFEEPAPEVEEPIDVPNGDTVFPEDRRPIVVVAAHSNAKSSITSQLISKYPATFTRAPAHVTRAPAEGEVEGRDYHFVDVQRFNVMRDGDQFLEFSEGADMHGTSRRVVEAISEAGKVAIMDMGRDGAQQVKDNGFSARFIFIQPPSAEIMEARLKEDGVSAEQVQEAVKLAAELAEHAVSGSFYDSVVDNDFKDFHSAVFGYPDTATEDRDLVMGDATAADSNENGSAAAA
ncbi:THO complex subunit 1 transcription elongation factor-domain-containing protein [Podospora appendiculata]|uniref:THO complex subunit 1 transcription elongation factor-domain-containing protein n=1 Tax=Podospora appendiculata TaxID=314037 RepID=A0AAE0XFJ4_9PEZI|nr:THO complex subunit 1 transcription elongation factor-domain-containing protein [Podospora appendiculata]